MTMIEKMADAMRRDYAANPAHCWEERARAALTALLEPDEGMLDAAVVAGVRYADECEEDGRPHGGTPFDVAFPAMIAAALASQEA